MKKIVFECETITPMFLYGADGKTPELRAPSIKGVLRFWWRAANGHLSVDDLRKKEAEIFGDAGEQGKSKVNTRIVENEVFRENDLKRTFKREKKLIGKDSGVGYLFYSQFLNRNKKFIKNNSKFSVTFSGYDENALKHAVAAFWILSVFGGLGSRTRRGAGNFRIINVNDDNGVVKNTKLEFVLSGGSQEEIEQKILNNFKKARKIINESVKTRFVFEYSNLSVSKLILSNKGFDNWKDALNNVGGKFADFRTKYKTKIFDVASFGFPILHRTPKKTIIVGRVNNSEIIERRSSPLIFRILKIGKKYYWLLIKLSGKFLPENTVLISKLELDKRPQKPDFSLFERFWNIAKESGKEIVLSLSDE